MGKLKPVKNEWKSKFYIGHLGIKSVTAMILTL